MRFEIERYIDAGDDVVVIVKAVWARVQQAGSQSGNETGLCLDCCQGQRPPVSAVFNDAAEALGAVGLSEQDVYADSAALRILRGRCRRRTWSSWFVRRLGRSKPDIRRAGATASIQTPSLILRDVLERGRNPGHEGVGAPLQMPLRQGRLSASKFMTSGRSMIASWFGADITEAKAMPLLLSTRGLPLTLRDGKIADLRSSESGEALEAVGLSE